ncbi:alkylhydroperoxidase like protein, AhpD family [Halorhabdus utahensis DSM 12940]|uniref:Alkylhydroperoxidase like protein, AhpD family n=2 Tax=Halorhabdus utahensis TaxID=146826 RepID=C7NRP1_HALUD|nr:alkylhydroperoxidase like protein, AhpD family [Halorhabdus utahensis DSM 12940]
MPLQSNIYVMSKSDELAEMKQSLHQLVGEAENLEGFAGYVEATESPGALDTKAKELMSLAVGCVARCEHCVLWHMDGALEAGATREEVIETLEVAVLMGGGPAMTYAIEAYEILEELEAEKDA